MKPRCDKAGCICGDRPFACRQAMLSLMVDDDAGNPDQCCDDDIYGLLYKLQQAAEDYEPIDKSLAERIVKRSHKEINALTLGQKATPARFHLDEINVGPLCGTGGFSSVYEISSLGTSSDTDFTQLENEARQNLVKTCKLSKSKGRYALKHLRPKLIKKPKKFANGAIDLAVEAAFLSSLDHPNILKIRGVAAAGVDGFAEGRHDSYFLIVDRLEKTLEDRILEWRKQHKRLNGKIMGKLMDKKGKKRSKLLVERLKVAFNIASAVEYLHSRGLIYRDLKTNNVGFDADGTVQIFDFGLCRELPHTPARRLDDVFKMSGGVGTYRYMAPEVARKQHYNEKADVFSFAMVLYEILSLNQLSLGKKKKGVDGPPMIAEGSLRLCQCWPAVVVDLIKRSASHDITERPSMKEVCAVLRHSITELAGDDFRLEIPGDKKNNNDDDDNAVAKKTKMRKNSKRESLSTASTARTLSIGPSISNSRKLSIGKRS